MEYYKNVGPSYLSQLSILGFMLLRQAAEAFGWKLNYGGIALMWRGGCIIRSAFLGKIKAAFDSDPDLVCMISQYIIVVFIPERLSEIDLLQ